MLASETDTIHDSGMVIEQPICGHFTALELFAKSLLYLGAKFTCLCENGHVNKDKEE